MRIPTVTIITVCYNAGNTIARTLQSVLDQTFTNYEYIIVDGLSTDNTNEIINEYLVKFKEKGITVIYISEKDSGIYDAMNKGAKLAKGIWLNYMNADDKYHEDKTLAKVFDDAVDANIGVIYGDTMNIAKEGNYLKRSHPVKSVPYSMPFCHQSAFVRTKLQQGSPFEWELYKITADYSFFLKLYIAGIKFVHLDIVVADYSTEGISGMNTVQVIHETAQIAFSNGITKGNDFHIKAKTLMKILCFKFRSCAKRIPVIKQLCPLYRKWKYSK